MGDTPIVEVGGRRAGSTYYHRGDGFYFFVRNSDSTPVYLQCVNTRDCKCSASMPLKKNMRTYSSFHINGAHTHEADVNLLPELELRRRILERVKEEPTEPRQIFDEECARVPLEVASRIGYSELKSAIERAKKTTTEKIPQTLQEFSEMLENPNNSKYSESVSGDSFFMGSMSDEEGAVSVIFGSKPFIDQLDNAEEIHIDGTFKVRPTVPESRQLLTVMSMHMNQAFPVFYILMERKTLASYRSVLNFIKGKAPNLKPKVVITDFERSLQSAVAEVFPTSKVVGCWYHSANAMRKKAKNLGLTNLLSTNPHAKKAVSMTMALPLLPNDLIENGFNLVKVYADHNGLGADLHQFFQYIQNTWIEGVGAQHLSVFKQARRTNNDQEAYHRNLMRKMRHAHPNIWVFAVTLKSVEHSYRQKYGRLVNGGTVPAKRPAYLAQDKNIAEATRNLMDGLYTVLDFLHRTSHAINNLISPAVPTEDDHSAGEDIGPPPQEPVNFDEETLDIPQEAQPTIRGGGRGGGRGGARGRGRGRGRGVRGRGRGNHFGGQAVANEVGENVDDPPAPAGAVARGRGRGLGRGGAAQRGGGGRGRGALAQGNNDGVVEDPYLNYRVVPTLEPHMRFMALEQIECQANELKVGLSSLPQDDQPSITNCCLVCQTNKASRICSPCGHAAFCHGCASAFVQRARYYSTIRLNGEIEEVDIRLPLICPSCRAVIGQIIRVYL